MKSSGSLPVFETPRLILRGVTLADAPGYQKYFVNYEVIRHLTRAVPWPYPEGGIEDYIQNQILPRQGDNYWAFGLFLKENTSEMIGGITLWRPGTPENRGFWLGEPFWGQGLMTEANGPLLDFAFQTLGFEKLILSNAKGNLRSRNLKVRCNARYLGTRQAEFVDRAYTESELWELKP